VSTTSNIVSPDGASPGALADVPVAVLAGGLGTRLRSVLPDRPKVLAEVAGRPFLAYQLERLARAGIVDVVVCLGYLAGEIERFIAAGDAFEGLQVRSSREPVPLGTAGALRLARKDAAGTFLALNGDSFFDVPLERLLAHHRRTGARATLAAARVTNAGRYGALELEGNGRVRRFLEKGGQGSGLVNAGIYVLEAAVLDGIPPDRPTSLEHDIFPALAAEGSLTAMAWDGYFIDIGIPDDLAGIDRDPGRLLEAVRSTEESV